MDGFTEFILYIVIGRYIIAPKLAKLIEWSFTRLVGDSERNMTVFNHYRFIEKHEAESVLNCSTGNCGRYFSAA